MSNRIVYGKEKEFVSPQNFHCTFRYGIKNIYILYWHLRCVLETCLLKQASSKFKSPKAFSLEISLLLARRVGPVSRTIYQLISRIGISMNILNLVRKRDEEKQHLPRVPGTGLGFSMQRDERPRGESMECRVVASLVYFQIWWKV